MKHFDISEWADLARGVVPAEARTRMDAHLTSGCGRCRTALDFVQRVVTVARAADNDEPPADAVRWAKAISALRQPQETKGLRLLGRLVFDSFREPLAAGMRAGDRGSRHALYEAGNFCLDLRLEHEMDSALVTLVGQVTDREDPDRHLTEAPVLLMARKDVVAHAVCNSFGEFQMEYPPTQYLRLCIAVDQTGRSIELRLSQLKTATLERSVRERHN